MVILPCAVGCVRRYRVLGLPDWAWLTFDHGSAARSRPTGLCPSCRMPVMVLGNSLAGEASHVSFGRPETAVLACSFCGGLAHRGVRTVPRMAA